MSEVGSNSGHDGRTVKDAQAVNDLAEAPSSDKEAESSREESGSTSTSSFRQEHPESQAELKRRQKEKLSAEKMERFKNSMRKVDKICTWKCTFSRR